MKEYTGDKRTYVESIMTDVIHAGEHFVYSQDPTYHAREAYITAHHVFVKDIHSICAQEDRHGACVLLETYLSDLEDREIAYKQWEIEGHHATLQDDMHDDLDLLLENPSALRIAREKIDAWDHVMEAMHTTTGSELDRRLYVWLDRGELVVVCVIFRIFLLLLSGVLPQDDKHRHLFVFVGTLGIAMYLLRKTKHKIGLLVVMLLVVSMLLVIPVLT